MNATSNRQAWSGLLAVTSCIHSISIQRQVYSALGTFPGCRKPRKETTRLPSAGVSVVMGITIRDVAERSRVSISTTSRALNGRSDVSKDVRARVLAAARDLNYTANQHARA